MPETKHEDTYRSFKGKHPFLPKVPSHSLHHYLMSGGVFMLCQQTLPTAPIMRMECLLSLDAWDCVCLFIVQVHLNVIDGRSLLDHPPTMEPRLLIISVSCGDTQPLPGGIVDQRHFFLSCSCCLTYDWRPRFQPGPWEHLHLHLVI